MSYDKDHLYHLMDKTLLFIEQQPRTRRDIMIRFHMIPDHDMDMILSVLEKGRVVERKYHIIKRKTKG